MRIEPLVFKYVVYNSNGQKGLVYVRDWQYHIEAMERAPKDAVPVSAGYFRQDIEDKTKICAYGSSMGYRIDAAKDDGEFIAKWILENLGDTVEEFFAPISKEATK